MSTPIHGLRLCGTQETAARISAPPSFWSHVLCASHSPQGWIPVRLPLRHRQRVGASTQHPYARVPGCAEVSNCLLLGSRFMPVSRAVQRRLTVEVGTYV